MILVIFSLMIIFYQIFLSWSHSKVMIEINSFRSIDAKHQLPIFTIDTFYPTQKNSIAPF